jgi:hypothetical protein
LKANVLFVLLMICSTRNIFHPEKKLMDASEHGKKEKKVFQFFLEEIFESASAKRTWQGDLRIL